MKCYEVHWNVRLELEQWKCSAIASQILKTNISRSPCPGFLGHMATDFWLQSWKPVIAEAQGLLGIMWPLPLLFGTSNAASSTAGSVNFVNFWFRSPSNFRPNHVKSTPAPAALAISKSDRCRQPWLGHGEQTDGARSSRCMLQLLDLTSTHSTFTTARRHVESFSTFTKPQELPHIPGLGQAIQTGDILEAQTQHRVVLRAQPQISRPSCKNEENRWKMRKMCKNAEDAFRSLEILARIRGKTAGLPASGAHHLSHSGPPIVSTLLQRHRFHMSRLESSELTMTYYGTFLPCAIRTGSHLLAIESWHPEAEPCMLWTFANNCMISDAWLDPTETWVAFSPLWRLWNSIDLSCA